MDKAQWYQLGVFSTVVALPLSFGLCYPQTSCDPRGIAEFQVRSYANNLAVFWIKHHRYPEEAEGLKVWVKPSRGPVFVETSKPDPWGNPLRYQVSGSRRQFVLASNGADGLIGTEDDIVLHGRAYGDE